jgi:hypothetical protein
MDSLIVTPRRMASIRRRSSRISSPASLPIRLIGQRTTTLELDPRIRDLRSSGMTMHVNKVHHVTTIT